jgi:ribosomal protein S18 acetylase RimI-like enzyme
MSWRKNATQIRKPDDDDWNWILAHAEPIGGAQVVSLDVLHHLRDHEALVAVDGERRLGFAVYRRDVQAGEASKIELIGLRAVTQWAGTGTALMAELETRARAMGVSAITLCTTNDNLSALRFYQRRGYRIKAVNEGEFRNILKMKGFDPDTEVIGNDGIRIWDEIVLEKGIVED